MDAKEKERRIHSIRLRAVILKGLVTDLKDDGGIDMRQEMIIFFGEEEENESKNTG